MGVTQAAIGRLERAGANPTVGTARHGAERHWATNSSSPPSSAPRSVDETLVASYLRLSPAERLAAFQESHASLAAALGRLRAMHG